MSLYPHAHQQPQQMGGQTSGKAIASMVVSLVGLFACPLICGIIGVVLGNSAMSEIRASGGRIQGEGMARAGIIIGYVGIALNVLACILYAVMFAMIGPEALEPTNGGGSFSP